MSIFLPHSYPFLRQQYPYERRSLPPKLYRVDRENAFTTHYPNDLLIFQAQGSFDLDQDLNKERVERHLTWKDRTSPPSSYISVFDNFDKAEKRAKFHFHRAPPKWQARRISIARVDTSQVVQAEYRPRNSKAVIPIWVDQKYIDKPAIYIPTETLEKDRTHIWICIAEVRPIFKIPWGIGQDDEWLACGYISKDKVDCIMPYDGVKVYTTPEDIKIRFDGWEFDWDTWRWNRTKVYVGIVEEDEEDMVDNTPFTSMQSFTENSLEMKLSQVATAIESLIIALQESTASLKEAVSQFQKLANNQQGSEETEMENVSSQLERINL